MKNISFGLFACLVLIPSLAAQPSAPAADWSAWKFIIGDWEGEGSGSPGQGRGGFSFMPDLQGRILVRKNYTDFPATKDRPATVHEDLLIISQEADGTHAVYWDNEGHVIRYRAELPAEGTIVFLSEKQAGAPRFRLIYKKISDTRVDILFEMAAPDKPDEFKAYLHGTARKK